MKRQLLVGLLLVQGSAACLGQGRYCTEAACGDYAQITVQRADGTTPPLAMVLEIDGRRVTCPAPEAKQAGRACDDRQVQVAHQEQTDCTEMRTATAVSESCVRNGRLALVLTIAGTPQRVVATLMADTSVVGQRTFDLSYQVFRPNGEGCEPVCRQQRESWEIP